MTWFHKKRSCYSSPDGRWNNVLYERGCLLKIITCDIYGFAKIFDFILDCDFNVLFDFDSIRVILNENRDLVFFVLQDSLMAVNTWTHLGLLREPMRFFCVATGNSRPALLLICQGTLPVPMPLRPPACNPCSCENASKWCLFCAVILKLCKGQIMKKMAAKIASRVQAGLLWCSLDKR